MALEIFRTPEGYLCVIERIFGWRSTKPTYWYYDTENWLCSRLGQKNEKPSAPMDDGHIKWVDKYYLPKAD